MVTGKRTEAGDAVSRAGYPRAPARAYLRAMGLTDEDISRPIVAVGSAWNEATPCHVHLTRLAGWAKEGGKAAGGIAMGDEGMKPSLVSREVIADSAELMVMAHGYDALVGIAGCDKSLPGMLMAMARLNVPSVFLYGGTIKPGRDHPGRVRGRRRRRGGAHERARAVRPGVRRLPWRGLLRRHVYRQHDGLRQRSAGYGAPL